MLCIYTGRLFLSLSRADIHILVSDAAQGLLKLSYHCLSMLLCQYANFALISMTLVDFI